MKRKTISELERTIYTLYSSGELKQKDIATAVGVSLDTVKATIAKVKNVIRFNKLLEKKCQDPDNIYNLDITQSTINFLSRANYTSIQQVDRAIKDGTLINVRGIGPIVLETLKKEVTSYMSENSKIYNDYGFKLMNGNDYMTKLRSFVLDESSNVSIMDAKHMLIDIAESYCVVFAYQNINGSDYICDSRITSFVHNYEIADVEDADREKLKEIIQNMTLHIIGRMYCSNGTMFSNKFSIACIGDSLHADRFDAGICKVCTATSLDPFRILADPLGLPVDILIGFDSFSIN